MVIDSHAHVFPDHLVDRAMAALTARYGVSPVARPTPDALLRHMDECGVDAAVIVAVATKPEQVGTINRWLASLAGPRLIPFGALHPHCENLAAEVDRLVSAGFRGVKLQPHFQGYRLDDPRFSEMIGLIGDRLIVLLHGGDEIVPIEDVQPTPQRLRALHHQFPSVRFIFAHLGASGMWDEVERHLVGENVWFDASYVFDICSDQQIERIIRHHGPDRIVWGSDFPWQSQRQGIQGVARLCLSDSEKRALLGANMLRLLNQFGTGPLTT